MFLPYGNSLFEHIFLAPEDVQILMENFTNNKFTGYLIFEENRKFKGGFFYSLGTIKSAFEISDSGQYKLIKNANLLTKSVARRYSAGAYVLSPKIVDVFSYIYLYSPVETMSEVRKKDFKKFLSNVEANSITGFAIFSIPGNLKAMVFSHGRLVIDSFAGEYGNILCQHEQIDSFIDSFPKDGAKVTLYGEKSFDLEEKDLIARRTLEYEKELKVKTMRGIIGGQDSVKIDEMFFKEWGVKPSLTIQVELLTPVGSNIVKCNSAKNMSGFVSVPSGMMKKLNLSESMIVNIKPVMQ